MMTCEWYARCDHEAVALVSHPILGEVPTCARCIDLHSMRERVICALPTCLDAHNDAAGCSGVPRFRESLSGTGTPIPRCDAHWTARLALQDEINARYPERPPADFDPLYAGESWDED